MFTDNNNQEAEFEKEWLSMEKYDFKILTLIAVLAQNGLAYRGKLKDMCEFLGVANQTNNKNKIKEAIENLQKDGYIYCIKDGQTYTLTLQVRAERDRQIIRIKKQWVAMIKDVKGAAWDTILRVWLYLIDNHKEIIRNADIATDLNISVSTVKRVKTILVDELHAIKCTDRAKKIAPGTYIKLGQTIDTFAWID